MVIAGDYERISHVKSFQFKFNSEVAITTAHVDFAELELADESIATRKMTHIVASTRLQADQPILNDIDSADT